MMRFLKGILILFLPMLLALVAEAQTGPAYFEYPVYEGCAAPFYPQLDVINQATAGGTFSASPATGLTLNPQTGTIAPSTSTPGSYVVTYSLNSTPPDSYSVTVTIHDFVEANLSYPVSYACKETHTLLAVDSGSFTPVSFYYSSPAGLALNNSTGEINVTNSSAGVYSIGHITQSPFVCSDTAFFQMEISDLGGYQLDYGQDTFCPVGFISPLVQPPVQGAYAGLPGLAFSNATQGVIDLAASVTDRIYLLVYNETGGCQRNFTDTIYLSDFDDAAFSYGAAVVCGNDDSLVPLIGADTGVFTWSAQFANSLLDIGPTTGTINPPLSSPDFYDVTHTTAGRCPSSHTETILIQPAPFPFTLINYGDSLLEVPVGGYVEWFCDGVLVSSDTSFLPISQFGIYWAEVTNSSGCTRRSNIVNTDPTGTPEPDLLSQLVRVYPNPSTGVFQIRTDLAAGGEITVEVYDLQGRKLGLEEFPASAGGEIDLTGKAAGNYMLRVSYRQAVSTYHLIKIAGE